MMAKGLGAMMAAVTAARNAAEARELKVPCPVCGQAMVFDSWAIPRCYHPGEAYENQPVPSEWAEHAPNPGIFDNWQFYGRSVIDDPVVAEIVVEGVKLFEARANFGAGGRTTHIMVMAEEGAEMSMLQTAHEAAGGWTMSPWVPQQQLHGTTP